MILFAVMLVAGLVLHRHQALAGPLERPSGVCLSLDPARCRALHRSRLRVRQRLPRHRQRRRHLHLHPLARAPRRRRLLRHHELHRRPAQLRRRGLLDHHPPARRAHSQGQQGRRLLHGIRVARRRHPLEPRHLVEGPSRLQLAHHDRLHHRRRRRQSAHAGQLRNLRRRVGAGHQGLQGAPSLARGRLCHGRAALPPVQAPRPRSPPLQGPRGHPRLRRSTSASSSSAPAAVSATSTAPTTARRAWASSCSSWSAPFPPPTLSTTP